MGDYLGGTQTNVLCLHTSNPCSFLAFQSVLGLMCWIALLVCPFLSPLKHAQTFKLFSCLVWEDTVRQGLRGWGWGETLRTIPSYLNLKISKVSSIEKLQNTFLLHKYYHFLRKLLVDEKQVHPGLILSFSYSCLFFGEVYVVLAKTEKEEKNLTTLKALSIWIIP